MSMIVNISNKGFENQSHRMYPENWNEDGWIAVPPELESVVQENAPYCDLVIKDGVLVNVTPTERPLEPEPEPTELEKIRADIDFLAVMTGVEL